MTWAESSSDTISTISEYQLFCALYLLCMPGVRRGVRILRWYCGDWGATSPTLGHTRDICFKCKVQWPNFIWWYLQAELLEQSSSLRNKNTASKLCFNNIYPSFLILHAIFTGTKYSSIFLNCFHRISSKSDKSWTILLIFHQIGAGSIHNIWY